MPSRQVKGYLRYGLWLALVRTANANRRDSGLATAWAPHLVGNTIALLLPEIFGAIHRLFRLDRRLNHHDHPDMASFRVAAERLVRDNPDYVNYVAPPALAYIVSHPQFNIYRGKLGQVNILGFGLDTIPHAATAYALTNLAYDTLDELDRNTAGCSRLRPYVGWLASRKTLVSAGFITALTIVYELGEYQIHQAELKARDYDADRINMVWNVPDMIFDVLSNAAGWALSTWLYRKRSV